MARSIQDSAINSKDALIEECRLITRYLVGKLPTDDLIQRYLEANSFLLASKDSLEDRAIVIFVRRNLWSLPYVDAALGLLKPDSLLRNKILLMIAVLEAAPQFAEFFIPEKLSMTRFLQCVMGCGLSSVAKLLVGCCIYPFAISAK